MASEARAIMLAVIGTGCGRSGTAARKVRSGALAAGVVAVVVAFLVEGSGAQAQPMQSQPGPGERDTAERPGGQAGGIGLGVGYELPTLRCGANEAIVGAQIRRGDVLDHLQIACAAPTCTAAGCRWTQRRWGPEAGNPSGGDPHPAMICAQNEAVASFRARVVAFTRFDYAADLAIECAALTSGPDSQGFFRVAAAEGRWHHPDGGFARSHAPGNAVRNTVTPPITCRPNGAASAFSLGVSANFVREGQRVVQAISLYCPTGQPDPSCPETLAVAGILDQRTLVEEQWFARGGRTGGGIVSVMEARPPSRSWRGARLVESLGLGANSCNLAGADRLCTTGGRGEFVVGVQGPHIDLPIGNVTVPWSQGVQAQNSFPDSHFVLDAGAGQGRARGVSALGTGAGPCVVSCVQRFTCGRGTQQVSYGPFTITYTLRRDSYQPLYPGLIRIPTGPPVAVTRVSVAKQ